MPNITYKHISIKCGTLCILETVKIYELKCTMNCNYYNIMYVTIYNYLYV